LDPVSAFKKIVDEVNNRAAKPIDYVETPTDTPGFAVHVKYRVIVAIEKPGQHGRDHTPRRAGLRFSVLGW
jgi:hypothetical protein